MSVAPVAGADRVTVPGILARKSPPENSARKITCLTAYDYPTARLLDEAGVDVVLVGDSLGMVVLGYENTLPVTMEEMLHHTRAVRRGVRRALLVADMPYGSYHVDTSEAVRNAVRFVKEARRGGREDRRRRAPHGSDRAAGGSGNSGDGPYRADAAIACNALGGFRVQGKRAEAAAKQLLRDAHAVEAAGAFSIVLESIPRELAARITRELRIPTIGIGAGPDCDGQILVLHDLIGLPLGPYAEVRAALRQRGRGDFARRGRSMLRRRPRRTISLRRGVLSSPAEASRSGC